MTNDLPKRAYEHKTKVVPGFTKKYNVSILVYYEQVNTRLEAIHREKQLKRWNRSWKLELIEKLNPKWDDLYNQLL